jgi:hypothetical protein
LIDNQNYLLSDTEKFALTVVYQRKLVFAPILNTEFGYRYPEAETTFRVSQREAIGKLNSLSKRGYLIGELCATILKCPKCDNYKLVLRLQCPYCSSFKLTKGSSIKHYPCGHVNFEEAFRRGEELFCPNCGKKLEKLGSDYMRAGVWYRCLDCKRNFGEPKELLYCPKCDEDFEREELVLEPLYSFSVDEAKIRDVLLDIDLGRLEEALINNWIVEIPAKVMGESGIEHTCSVALTRRGALGNKLFIDIEYAADFIDVYAVMHFFAKIMDIKAGPCILIGMPRFSEDSKKLADVYKIRTIEGSKFSEIVEEIQDYLEVMMEEKTSNVRQSSRPKRIRVP